jgi:hypothetical protein
LAPHEPVDKYWHNRTGEDNADAHLKRQVMGREGVVADVDQAFQAFFRRVKHPVTRASKAASVSTASG